MSRPRPTPWLLALVLAFTSTAVHAAGVVSLKDNLETAGKLTLSPTGIHIDTGASPIDAPLDTVLEANFSDRPFHIDYFSSVQSPNQLPAAWKAQDIGKHPNAKDGSVTYANGVLTITGSGYDYQRGDKEDQMFIIGQTWTGSGQLTGRLKDMAPNPTPTSAGPMERSSTDPLASMRFMSMHSGDGGGLYVGRGNDGDHVGWNGFPADYPTWFRMSWNGTSLDSEVSGDGRKWATVGQDGLKSVDNIWVGLAVNSGQEAALGSGVFDQILMTPSAAEPGTYPTGVLFTSGTFLAGGVDFLNQNNGQMGHAGKGFQLSPKQVAAIFSHPVTKQQMANITPPGLLFKNGDLMQADFDNIQGTGFFQITSLVLGSSTYYGDAVRAYFIRNVAPIPSEYEVRLHDGSIIQVKDFTADGAQLALNEVSGVTIHIDPAEIAQFRAGTARVQNLINLDWKSSASSPGPVATKPDEGKTKSAPVATTAVTAPKPDDAAPLPDANSFAAPPIPPVETWQGPNQEQIIVVAAGNQIQFPLTGKFSSLSTRVALSPDSPAAAQASLRILVDGKEAGGGPTLKSGDAPQRLSVPVQNPKSIAFAVESVTPGARLLLIDPVALRDIPAAAP